MLPSKKKRRSRVIGIRLQAELVEELDAIASKYRFASRTELLKHMIRYCLHTKCYEV